MRAQRYSASAIELGVELSVNTSETSQHEAPAVAIADNGAFTIAWQGRDGNGDGITARAYDSNGNALTVTDQVVNTTVNGLQDAPDVAMASDGSSLVVWRNNTAKEIRGRRYDAAGIALGDEFVISTTHSVKPEAPCASLAGDGSSYIVMYEARDGNGSGVFALWVPLQ